MAWNRKVRGPAKGYFYLSKRIDGRVRKVYWGGGSLAELAAEMHAEERAQRAAARQARQDEELRVQAAVARLEEAGRLVALLMRAALVLKGFRLHRGRWRRRRRDDDDEGGRPEGAGRRGPDGG